MRSRGKNGKLQILALVTDAFGGEGGIAQYNRDLLKALTECSLVEQVMVLPRRGAGGEGPPISEKLVQLAPVSERLAYSVRAFRQAIKQTPIDVVFCGHLFMAPLARAVAAICCAKLWVQLHGVEAWPEASRLQRQSLEAAQLVTSVSRYTRRRVLRWSSLDPAKIKVLPNTFDDRFRPAPKLAKLIERYRLRGKKVLMTVSRLSAREQYKGQDRVIAALRSVAVHHPEVVYLIVGDGDDRSRLQRLAVEYGVDERVQFLGNVTGEELPSTMRLADVLVMPSTGEGFGIVFLEALALGIPVIGGDQDASLDPLADGVLGTVVDPYDDKQLIKTISRVLKVKPEIHGGAERFAASSFKTHLQGLLNFSLAHAA